MRIIGIAVVRNQADIIEVFVRHNRALLDGLIVIDSASTDGTLAILRRLAAGLGGVGVAEDASLDRPAGRLINHVVGDITGNGGCDFLLPLAADEFLDCAGGRPGLEQALASLPPGCVGLVPHTTYVPCSADDPSECNPVLRIRHRRATERDRPAGKVVIPLGLARRPGFAVVAAGGGATTSGLELPAPALTGVRLARYPVRSPEQLVAHAYVESWAARGAPLAGAGEGFPWHDLAVRLNGRTRVSRAETEQFAATYPGRPAEALVVDPLRTTAAIQWPELAAVDGCAQLAGYAQQRFAHLDRTLFESSWMAVGRTRQGVMGYHRSDEVIGRSIERYGEWAADELEVLLRELAPGQNVVDVGANIGTHAIPMAMHVGPAGSVFAFEPQRLTFQMLCANAALNGVPNLFAYQLGLGSGEGAGFVPPPDRALSGNVGNFNLEAHLAGESVRVVPLDSLDLPPIHVIKIDVEGMEAKVLQGARQRISRDRPLLFIENNIPANSSALISVVLDLGYEARWHIAPYFNPENLYGNPENIFNADRPEINIVCAHRSRGTGADHPLTVRGPGDTWQAAIERARQAAG